MKKISLFWLICVFTLMLTTSPARAEGDKKKNPKQSENHSKNEEHNSCFVVIDGELLRSPGEADAMLEVACRLKSNWYVGFFGHRQSVHHELSKTLVGGTFGFHKEEFSLFMGAGKTIQGGEFVMFKLQRGLGTNEFHYLAEKTFDNTNPTFYQQLRLERMVFKFIGIEADHLYNGHNEGRILGTFTVPLGEHLKASIGMGTSMPHPGLAVMASVSAKF